jgi:hypothetical protein
MTKELTIFEIELLKKFPCESKEELLAEEGKFIKEKGTLNGQVAGRTKEQYKEDNKEYIAEKNQEWYEKNKEREQEKHREYNRQHKEHLGELNKQYYQDKKDIIRAKAKEKIICGCGMEMNREHLSKHKKRQIHIELMSKKIKI